MATKFLRKMAAICTEKKQPNVFNGKTGKNGRFSKEKLKNRLKKIMETFFFKWLENFKQKMMNLEKSRKISTNDVGKLQGKTGTKFE